VNLAKRGSKKGILGGRQRGVAMIRNILIIVSFSVAMHVCAMQPICYLARMPLDVQAIILFFVKDDETDEESVARTKHPPVPDSAYDTFVLSEHFLSKPLLRAFSPDKTEVALFLPPYYLTIVDCEKKQLLRTDVLFSNGDEIKCIALSRGANLFAMVKSVFDFPKSEKICYGPQKDILFIYNLVRSKKRECTFYTKMDEIFSVAFNKQRTKVIVHGTTRGTLDDELEERSTYAIFPINNYLHVNAERKREKKSESITLPVIEEKPSLQQYLKERRICQSLEYSNKK
jgi:hypothetical protein